jgi:hypothetical protein
VHVVSTNVAAGTLPANGQIQIAFDRLLLPECILRQTFILLDAQNNVLSPLPVAAYDPVAIVVTVTPAAGTLVVGQPYKLVINSPQNSGDLNGLRAIDGATLASDSKAPIGFTVTAATATPPPQPPVIDYCRDVQRVLVTRCAGCHGGLFYAGLGVATAQQLEDTAINMVAHGSNTGPNAAPEPATLQFTEDMPVIDPGPGPNVGLLAGDAGPQTSGNPGHSWLMYKLLMAVPLACDRNPGSGFPPCDGGTLPPDAAAPPVDTSGVYQVTCSDAGAPCPQPLSDDERARLSNMIPGREMPYPGNPDTPLDQPTSTLTVQELEILSFWIAQGAQLSSSCP